MLTISDCSIRVVDTLRLTVLLKHLLCMAFAYMHKSLDKDNYIIKSCSCASEQKFHTVFGAYRYLPYNHLPVCMHKIRPSFV